MMFPVVIKKKLWNFQESWFQALGQEECTGISLPIRTNGKPLAATGKFSINFSKLMIGKTLATNGEEITNTMTGNDVLAIYW